MRVNCVIMCYGFNGSRRETNRIAVKMARVLADKNIACIRFDYLGCGVSEGEFSDYTISDRIKQVELVAAFALSLSKVNSVSFIGFSDGCRVVMEYLFHRENTNDVRSLVFWSPVFVAEAAERQPLRLKRRSLDRKLYYSHLGLWIHPQYFRVPHVSYMDMALAVAPSLRTLFVFGTNDQESKNTQKIISDSVSEGNDLAIYHIEGAPHLFESPSWITELIEVTAAFIGDGRVDTAN